MTTNPRLELIEARAALKSYGAEGYRFEKAVRAVALHDAAQNSAAGPPAARAAVLRELEERYRSYARDSAHPDFRAAYAAVANDLSRLADETQQQPETRPARGDQFEQWLKAQRDASADHPEAYQAADGLLDLYRLHADMGVPLGGHVCEGRVVGDCECLEQPAVVSAVPPQPEETA